VVEAGRRIPVAGAVAALWAEGRLETQTLADAAGAFRIEGVPAGRYELRVDKPGYQLARRVVALAEGQTARTEMGLAGAGAITGRVLWQGARPVALAAVHGVRDGVVMATTHTRGDGWYRLSKVPPGTYDVVVHSRRYGAMNAPGVEVDGDEAAQDVAFEEARAPSPLSGRALAQGLRDIWAYRHLVYNLVRRDMRTRYKESMLGLLWSMLLPLATIGIYTFVFKYVWTTTRMPNYSIFLFCGLVPWLYFNQSMSDACNAVLSNRAVLTRVRMPPAVLPMAVVFQNLVHFMLMLLVFMIVLMFIPVHFYLPVVMLPLLIVLQIMLNMGLAFFLAALNTFYQDVGYAVGVVLQFMLFLSPILYPAGTVLRRVQNSSLPDWLFPVYMLNPVATLTTSYRDIFLGRIVEGTIEEFVPVFPHTQWVALLAVEAVIALVAGYVFFIKSQDRFTDVL